MAKFSLCRENIAKKHKKEKFIMELLFGSAATAARNVRGEEYFNKMIEEAVKQKNLKSSNIQTEKSQEESDAQELEKLVKRAVEREGVSDYEVEQLVLIYKDLAPEDTESPISIKMLNEFFENVVKPASPTGYAKLRKFYNFREYTCSEFKMRKFEIWRENFFKQFRTVEYCYQYSKGFKDMADRISKKLKAPESMGTVERCKWLRIWSVVLKDQGYHWKDVVNGRIDINQSRWFNKNFYFTPEVMISMEKDCFENVPDGALLLEMIQNLIALYPEDLQKEIRKFGELDENVPDLDCLKAEEIRNKLKKKMFPVLWVSGLGYYCTEQGIKTAKPEFLESAVKVYKDGNLDGLETFEQEAINPYNNFLREKFKCYELYTESIDEEYQRVLAIISWDELKMYIEVYKWLSYHSDFKFGPDNKTLSEYGIDDMLLELNSKWFLEMKLVCSEDDINWMLFEKIINGNEEYMAKYLKGELTAEDLFNAIGFSSVKQAKLCCNKETKLILKEEEKMAAALKRVKMFGTAQSIKSDLIYLEIFKYMLSEKPENLPKNMVNLYDKVFK